MDKTTFETLLSDFNTITGIISSRGIELPSEVDDIRISAFDVDPRNGGSLEDQLGYSAEEILDATESIIEIIKDISLDKVLSYKRDRLVKAVESKSLDNYTAGFNSNGFDPNEMQAAFNMISNMLG